MATQTSTRTPLGRVGALVGLTTLLFVLLAVVGASGWLGYRHAYRHHVLSDRVEIATVEVTTTWYSTEDPTFTWRGPVADGTYVTGAAKGQSVRVERLVELARPGETVQVRRGVDHPSIAQSASLPVQLSWKDLAPWAVVALALVPIPRVIHGMIRVVSAGGAGGGRPAAPPTPSTYATEPLPRFDHSRYTAADDVPTRRRRTFAVEESGREQGRKRRRRRSAARSR